jgi:biotin carboxylase
VEEGIARAEEIGFPVMIKASEGEYGYPPFVVPSALFPSIFLKRFL